MGHSLPPSASLEMGQQRGGINANKVLTLNYPLFRDAKFCLSTGFRCLTS